MRALKICAIMAFCLFLAAAAFVGYLYMTAEVRIVSASSSGRTPGEEEFIAIKSSLQSDTYTGTLYRMPREWKNANDYVLLTYKIGIRNDCLVPIDRIELQIVPQPVDILQFADLAPHSLDCKSKGEYDAVVFSNADTHPVREVIVTYFVWGRSFSIRTTVGG